MATETMLAAYSTGYGSPDVLEIKSIDKPIDKPTELMVKIKASSVTMADSLMRQGKPGFARMFLGITKPKYPVTGTGFSGEVVHVGKDVTLFKIGDHVFGETLFGTGSNTEFVSICESKLVLKKPEKLSFEAAATVCDGVLTSYSFIKDIGQLRKGQRILINGASGSLGTAAVQIAKHLGAYVVGVCSGKNADMVKELGADRVVDYTTTDFTQLDDVFDMIYDAVGKSTYSKCKGLLTASGKYLSPVLSFSMLWSSIYTALFSKKKALFSATGLRKPEELTPLLKEIKALLASGQLHVFIDKVYPLKDIAKAHQYVDTGRKRGNIVISMRTPEDV